MIETADATDSTDVEKLVQTVEELQETVERQAERIDELENELEDLKQHNGREHAQINQRVSEVENRQIETPSTDATPGVEADNGPSQNEQTPLERICALPEHVADRELTANQDRARFVAKDVRDYAEKAPAGLVIDSRAITRIITAKEGTRPHTQTVARIMNFLDDLGKGDIELKKRRGKKLVVVDPEAADRLADHGRCDGENRPTRADGVISRA